jgi:protein-export membrane protein SecD
VLEERTVGADLGADSIAAGKLASTMGIVMIAVAMLVLYGLFGVFANVALLLNGILLVGALSLLQATLTLPGIAGIALTLGMAVDSNVLVFERIREEIRNGRSPVTAIDHGYREAMSTIWDANLTTLISGLIMFMLGSGSVKGFAVTLSLGIITTIFTAVMVTRLITVLWLKRWRRGSQAQTLPL